MVPFEDQWSNGVEVMYECDAGHIRERVESLIDNLCNFAADFSERSKTTGRTTTGIEKS
jgi:hypothetical protein